MTPLRLIGVVVVVFLISLPVMHRLSGHLDSTTAGNEAENENSDDPVVDVLCLKGLAYAEKEQYDKAIAAYSEAIKRDSKYSFAFLGRGNAYVATGDLDRALLDYDQAVRLDPTNDTAKSLANIIREQRAKK
jgi:tetratricopeptide (TPR) repeat protein